MAQFFGGSFSYAATLLGSDLNQGAEAVEQGSTLNPTPPWRFGDRNT